MQLNLTETEYSHLNEQLSAATHGIAALASVGATIAMVNLAQTPLHRFAAMIFGFALIILYSASTTFHSFYFTKFRRPLQVIDHASVFVLITGSYTPFCLIGVGGQLGTWLLIAIASLSLIGILYKMWFANRFRYFETSIYILLGWLCLIGIVPLWQNLGPESFFLLVAGGIAYTVGAIIYLQQRIPFSHVVWHLFVMLGSTMMVLAILPVL